MSVTTRSPPSPPVVPRLEADSQAWDRAAPEVNRWAADVARVLESEIGRVLAQYVSAADGLMVGPLTLAGDAAGPLEAVTLQQLEASAAALDDAKVNRIGDTMTGTLFFPLGTAALPSVSFDGDPNTGMFSPTADLIGFATNGTQRFTIGNTSLSSGVPYRGSNGAVGTPSVSFSSDTDTGMYRTSADNLGFSTGGVLRVTIGNSAAAAVSVAGDVTANDFRSQRTASPTTGAIYFGNTSNHYLYFDGANYILGGATSDLSVRRLRGGPTDAGQLKTWNAGNTVNFRWYAGATNRMAYRIDEAVEVDICTSTNAAALGYVGGTGGPTGVSLNGLDYGGNLFAIYVDVVSDERIKERIRDTDVDALASIAALRVRSYDVKAEIARRFENIGKSEEQRRKTPPSAAPVPIGFVAQEVRKVMPEAVHVKEGPQQGFLPDDCHSLILPNMIPYLVRAIQQQQDQIAALSARIVALESRGARDVS